MSIVVVPVISKCRCNTEDILSGDGPEFATRRRCVIIVEESIGMLVQTTSTQ